MPRKVIVVRENEMGIGGPADQEGFVAIEMKRSAAMGASDNAQRKLAGGRGWSVVSPEEEERGGRTGETLQILKRARTFARALALLQLDPDQIGEQVVANLGGRLTQVVLQHRPLTGDPGVFKLVAEPIDETLKLGAQRRFGHGHGFTKGYTGLRQESIKRDAGPG
jgi:hypothetical protein